MKAMARKSGGANAGSGERDVKACNKSLVMEWFTVQSFE
jgi:hypothetical protein